jgi:hypothetical protein
MYNQAYDMKMSLNGVQRMMFLTFFLICRPGPESFSYLATDGLACFTFAFDCLIKILRKLHFRRRENEMIN